MPGHALARKPTMLISLGKAIYTTIDKQEKKAQSCWQICEKT